jgi:hypothetical protein
LPERFGAFNGETRLRSQRKASAMVITSLGRHLGEFQHAPVRSVLRSGRRNQSWPLRPRCRIGYWWKDMEGVATMQARSSEKTEWRSWGVWVRGCRLLEKPFRSHPAVTGSGRRIPSRDPGRQTKNLVTTARGRGICSSGGILVYDDFHPSNFSAFETN